MMSLSFSLISLKILYIIAGHAPSSNPSFTEHLPSHLDFSTPDILLITLSFHGLEAWRNRIFLTYFSQSSPQNQRLSSIILNKFEIPRHICHYEDHVRGTDRSRFHSGAPKSFKHCRGHD